MENVKTEVKTKNARLEKIISGDTITFKVVDGHEFSYSCPEGTDSKIVPLALFGVSNFVSNACAMSKDAIDEIIATKGQSGIALTLDSIVADTLARCIAGTINIRTNTGSGKSVTKAKLTDALKDSGLSSDLMASLAKKLGLTL